MSNGKYTVKTRPYMTVTIHFIGTKDGGTTSICPDSVKLYLRVQIYVSSLYICVYISIYYYSPFVCRIFSIGLFVHLRIKSLLRVSRLRLTVLEYLSFIVSIQSLGFVCKNENVESLVQI